MAKRFNLLFSLHSLAAAVELLYVHYLLRLMHPRISSALTLPVSFNSAFHVFGVSSVVAAIFTKKDINGVRHPSSTLI